MGVAATGGEAIDTKLVDENEDDSGAQERRHKTELKCLLRKRQQRDKPGKYREQKKLEVKRYRQKKVERADAVLSAESVGEWRRFAVCRSHLSGWSPEGPEYEKNVTADARELFTVVW